MPRQPHPTRRKQIFSLIFFAKQSTNRPAGDSGFANAAPDAPYPLPDGAATFTFPPISESLVLRKLSLLRLRPSKATADSLFCNRFLHKCAPFLGKLNHLSFQPLPINQFFSQRLETCKGHPSVQTPRQPVRSVKLPPLITLTSDR